VLAVVEELERRRDEGDTRVPVSDEALASLRAALPARNAAPATAPAARQPATPAARPAAAAEPPRRAAPPVPEPADTAPVPVPEVARVRRPKAERPPVPEGMMEVEPGFHVPALPQPPQVVLAAGDKATQWAALRATVLNDPVCRTHVRTGRQVVFGVGDIDSQIFFCGEAPGAEEEQQGEPFVGRAGQLLTKMIQGMGLSREQVYLGNILNWRPEKANMEVGNRKPLPVEMAYCLPYLQAQVRVVRPQVIVALGATAMEGLLGPDPQRKITRVRGTWFEYDGIPLLPTFHPSYVLQYGSAQVKRNVWEDLLKVMERVGLPISEKQRRFFLPRD